MPTLFICHCNATTYLTRAIAASLTVMCCANATAQTAAPKALPDISEVSKTGATVTGATVVAKTVLISELRTNGPGGSADAFVELANTSGKVVALSGWSLRMRNAKGQEFSFVIPDNISVPARGHLLLTGQDYSLNKLAIADLRLPYSFVGGIQLRDAAGKILDAVGPRQAANGFREGIGLEPKAFVDQKTQISCVRRVVSGRLLDSDENARNFDIVSVSGKLGGMTVRLGAPGPENTRSPLLRSFKDEVPSSKVKPLAEDNENTAQKPPLSAVRQHRPYRNLNDRGINKSQGTLLLSCHLSNFTDQPIEKLKFRVVGITNVSTPKNAIEEKTADLRFLSRLNEPHKNEREELMWDAVLDESPAQPQGGGLNSTLTVEMPDKGLRAHSESNVQWILGVERPGRYRVVMESEQFRIVFAGDTDASKSEAPQLTAKKEGQTGFNPRNNGGSSAMSSSAIGEVSNGVENNANTASKSAPAERVITATITFEGNTNDGVEPAIPRSKVGISAFRVAGATLVLRFNGVLDRQSAGDAQSYSVEVNGELVTVEGAAYDAARNTVTLNLPANALRRGDIVTVIWNNLKDNQGRILDGQVGPIKAP